MNNVFFNKLKKDYQGYEVKRRSVISSSSEALGLSKRAIFAFHRDNYKEGFDNLREAEAIFKELEKLSKAMPRLKHEGSWRAALEEYVEAKLFGTFLKDRDIGMISGDQIDTDIYLGGLCDFTGELVRRAIKEATAKNYTEVQTIKKNIELVVQNLIQLNLTGYLRTKYDQAKNNLRKIEEITYDISFK